MTRGLLMRVGAGVVGWAAFARLEACATGGGRTVHARHKCWLLHELRPPPCATDHPRTLYRITPPASSATGPQRLSPFWLTPPRHLLFCTRAVGARCRRNVPTGGRRRLIRICCCRESAASVWCFGD